MSQLPLALRRFAGVLQVRVQAPEVVDLVQIAKDWPQALAVRLLAALPIATLVASFQAIPSLAAAARVSQLLRIAGLDDATGEHIFKSLEALHAVNPARAFTLRRAMEWEAQDSVFWPEKNDWPAEEAERVVAIALTAEQGWKSLPLPCIYRLPAPVDYPDYWPELPTSLPTPPLPEALSEMPHTTLRAAIEWLHLWRLDANCANEIRAAVPSALFDEWIAALDAATDPAAEAPLPRDIVLFEHLTEQHDGTLSLLEIDALLKGVSEPADEDDFAYDQEGRVLIRKAVVGWMEKTSIATPTALKLGTSLSSSTRLA